MFFPSKMELIIRPPQCDLSTDTPRWHLWRKQEWRSRTFLHKSKPLVAVQRIHHEENARTFCWKYGKPTGKHPLMAFNCQPGTLKRKFVNGFISFVQKRSCCHLVGSDGGCGCRKTLHVWRSLVIPIAAFRQQMRKASQKKITSVSGAREGEESACRDSLLSPFF